MCVCVCVCVRACVRARARTRARVCACQYSVSRPFCVSGSTLAMSQEASKWVILSTKLYQSVITVTQSTNTERDHCVTHRVCSVDSGSLPFDIDKYPIRTSKFNPVENRFCPC